MKARASAGFCILAVDDGLHLLLQPAPNFRLLQQLGCSAMIMRVGIVASTESFEINCVFMAALSAILHYYLVFKQATELEIVVTLASTLIK